MENKRKKRLSRRNIKLMTEFMLICIDFLPIIIIAILAACTDQDVAETIKNEFIVSGNLIWLGCTYMWIMLANTIIKGRKICGKSNYLYTLIMNISLILAGMTSYMYVRYLSNGPFLKTANYAIIYVMYFTMLFIYVQEKMFEYIKSKKSRVERTNEGLNNGK